MAAVSVTAAQGEKYYVNARMQIENATARMLGELALRCASDAPELYSMGRTQNTYKGQALLVLRGRYISRHRPTARTPAAWKCAR